MDKELLSKNPLFWYLTMQQDYEAATAALICEVAAFATDFYTATYNGAGVSVPCLCDTSGQCADSACPGCDAVVIEMFNDDNADVECPPSLRRRYCLRGLTLSRATEIGLVPDSDDWEDDDDDDDWDGMDWTPPAKGIPFLPVSAHTP